MEKPYLFLDFDGLQFYTHDLLTKYLSDKYSVVINGSKEASDILNFVNQKRPDLNLTFYDFWVDIGKNFLSSIELHENLEPISMAQDVIPLLAEKYNIITITGRQISGINVVKYLSEKFFPGCIKGYHFMFRDTGINFFKISKRDYINGMFLVDKVAFIDDTLSEVLDTKDIIRSVLFDQNSFYKDADTSGITVVRSWSEIAEMEKIFL